ncbi:MAG TPA: hypothetical protein VFS83_05355 [Ktedonobacterales bacterium]|nr:hypothetical protein [Ktedonobacterales bacterium]
MSRHEAVTIVRHWWWVMALAPLLIGSLALIGWLRTPTNYVATRSVAIAMPPAGTPSAQDSYFAEQQALATARVIVSPGFLTAPAFDRAIAYALASSPDRALRQASPLTLGRALSASHTGATITLAATWGNATGAEALVNAAANALASSDPAFLALFGSGETPHFLAPSGNPHAIVDAETAAAARDTLLLRLALAVLAGVLVMGTTALLERRRYATMTANGEVFRVRKKPPVGRRA